MKAENFEMQCLLAINRKTNDTLINDSGAASITEDDEDGGNENFLNGEEIQEIMKGFERTNLDSQQQKAAAEEEH